MSATGYDIEAIVNGFGPVIRDAIERATTPLRQQITEQIDAGYTDDDPVAQY